jgi:flavanone 2-hydroxylase
VVAGTADAACDLLKFEASILERPLTSVTRHLAYDAAGFAFTPTPPLALHEALLHDGAARLAHHGPAAPHAGGRAGRHARCRRQGEALDVSHQLIRLTNNAIMRMVATDLPGGMMEAARECAKQVAEVFNMEDYMGIC